MLKALRISLGEGQSFQDVSIFTVAEIQQAGFEPIFGNATFVFREKKGICHVTHAQNVNAIHLAKIWPMLKDAIPYERIVCTDDSVYGPGHILRPSHCESFGIEPLFVEDGSCQALMFTADPEGLLLVTSHFIVTITSKAATQQSVSFSKHSVQKPKRWS